MQKRSQQFLALLIIAVISNFPFLFHTMCVVVSHFGCIFNFCLVYERARERVSAAFVRHMAWWCIHLMTSVIKKGGVNFYSSNMFREQQSACAWLQTECACILHSRCYEWNDAIVSSFYLPYNFWLQFRMHGYLESLRQKMWNTIQFVEWPDTFS